MKQDSMAKMLGIVSVMGESSMVATVAIVTIFTDEEPEILAR